jgi:hypothetical protein
MKRKIMMLISPSIKWLLCLFVLSLSGQGFVMAQDEGEAEIAQLRITRVDASRFPEVSFNLLAVGVESKPVPSLPDLALNESGAPVADFQVGAVPAGIEIVFVIDANRTINQRDGDNFSRREEVRDSIVRFAGQFMNQSQLDRVYIVVPDGSGARFLGEEPQMTFPNEVINAINFYDPGTLEDTPLQAMMTAALAKLAESRDDGRFQALVLMTDGASLNRQLSFEALVEEAQTGQVTIFAAVLGARADPDEIANVQRLNEPTNGFYIHMPEPASADPLFETIRGHATQHRIQYRSTLGVSDSRDIEVSLPGATGTAAYQVSVEPPSVRVAIDNSRAIRRVGPAHDTDLAEMEPAFQPVVAQVSWPDGFARQLTAADLIVNGTSQESAGAPVLDADGLLTFEWNIRDLDEGSYDLAVALTDELGLQAQSAPLPLQIEVERPAPPEPTALPPTAEVAGVSVNAPVDSEAAPDWTQRLGIITIVIGVLAVLFALFLIIVAVFMMRRRQAPALSASGVPLGPATHPVGAAPALGSLDHEATQVMMPAFAVAKTAAAFLEPLENSPEHRDPIAVTGSSVAIGRDPKLAQILLNDKSVSRLHARIMESRGVYRLYDEGSASGTYRNFERVGLTPQTLQDNDDIHIGRVHLRFRLATPASDSDSTQIMAAPARPGGARPGTPARPPADEDVSTQPFMPHQPQGPGRQAPPSPGRSQPEPPANDDPDDISTQPYMPHSPKR